MGAEELPRVVVHPDAGAFRRRAQVWLMEAEDEHNLILGLSDSMAGVAPGLGEDRQFWATIEIGGEVVGCAFRTPPHKLGVTRMPLDALPVLACVVAERYAAIPAVFGPTAVAKAFGEVWSDATGVGGSAGLSMHMYRVDEVVHPRGVRGVARTATAADLLTVHRWADDFARDTGHTFMTQPAAREGWIRDGELQLWEVDGAPVAMALSTGWTPNGARIGYVFTPQDRRGHGYASALTAAVSQRILDEGRRFCVLYTDATSPVPNAIYPRVGYRHLCDVVDVDFR